MKLNGNNIAFYIVNGVKHEATKKNNGYTTYKGRFHSSFNTTLTFPESHTYIDLSFSVPESDKYRQLGVYFERGLYIYGDDDTGYGTTRTARVFCAMGTSYPYTKSVTVNIHHTYDSQLPPTYTNVYCWLNGVKRTFLTLEA